MRNTIKAVIKFSFRGENYTPELIVDLDQLLKAEQDFTRLHEQLAQANGIDTYSYAYEVMESCEIEFSEATGDAVSFLQESGGFDLPGFKQSKQSFQSEQQLLEIARQHMRINSLDEVDGLKQALQAAFDAGASNN